MRSTAVQIELPLSGRPREWEVELWKAEEISIIPTEIDPLLDQFPLQ
jgi:hypothetical protein